VISWFFYYFAKQVQNMCWKLEQQTTDKRQAEATRKKIAFFAFLVDNAEGVDYSYTQQE